MGQSPGNLRNVTRRRPRLTTTRRVLTVVTLAVLALPAMCGAALAQDIGDRYSPDPLTPLEAWAVYGGTIIGGFLVAIGLTLLSSRGSGPSRYRPGRSWEHDEVWVGDPPAAAAEGEHPHVASPGAGGASGSW
ncbi:hypothetical protein FsymDg_1491 [Candidatus Protofrankia datiscae]|uniref:Uncharacterized protein n=2 Tax=Protofrankia TaxID=2994361 RepID=F8B2X1_9ACTN|nr:hypothetical protein FsymDg_1491 [Candidatus Protofrankia datiscae]KLL11536.1 hypothetical protein FrCorBMG51_10830 [Protofrankia coriariae]